jgi:hypothetical protein
MAMALERSVKPPVMAAISVVATILAGAMNVSAQTAAGVGPAPAIVKLPNSVIEQFKADPQGLLEAYPAGGLALSSRARSLVLTDPSLVSVLINVAKAGNAAQQAGIGAGMAEAARILAATDPQLAAQIQLAIAQSGAQALIMAFVAASNATQTASTVGVSTNFSASLSPSAGASASGGSSGGPAGGFASSGSSNLTPASSSTSNAASAFGPLGSSGGLTSATSQSTSPSKSSL